MNVVIFWIRSSREAKSPRRSTRRVRIEKKISIMLSQLAGQGGEGTGVLGWSLIHLGVALEVCEEPLSRMRWIFLSGSTVAASSVRNSMKVAESLRLMIFGWTVPAVTFMAAISDTVPWRTYSNSRRSTRPGRAGRVARVRERACMAGFSSTLNSTVSAGWSGWERRHPARALLLEGRAGGPGGPAPAPGGF